MSFLFTLLWLASNLVMVVFILVTLLEKDNEKKRRNRRVWLIALAVAVICFIIMLVTADSTSTNDKNEDVKKVEGIVEDGIKEIEDKKSEIDGTHEIESVSDEFDIEEAGSGESDSSDTEALETNDIVDKYSTDFIVGAKMTLDRYISNYKMSLAPQRWKIVKFDDTNTLIGKTEITYKDRKGDLYFVGTLEFDNEKVTAIQPHYIYVIDEIIDEDGYCDDVFDKINNM